MKNQKKVYCPNCFYFEVNINEAKPYYCSLWGLKTARSYHPSREIQLATGKECPYFYKQPLKKEKKAQKKHPAKKKNQGLDFFI